MTSRSLALLLTLFCCSPLAAAEFYFDGVNVIPMDSQRVLSDQRVLVADGRITAIGPAASTGVPAGAKRIDASGHYLIPGLAEMHAHVPGQKQGEQTARDVLMLYLANGITTIRGMLGEPWHLSLRDQLASGELTGPALVTSGPSFNGRTISSPEQAARMVREQADSGFDFLKLHPGLQRDEYRAIVAVAQVEKIPFAGHVSYAVGLPLTLLSGQASIDHLDGYAQELVLPTHPLHGEAPDFFGINLSAGITRGSIGELARATRDAGVWNVPTQSLLENILYAQSLETLMNRPEMVYMQGTTLRNWRDRVRDFRRETGPDLAEKYLSVRRALIKRLQDEGAGLLLGSDAPQMMNVPGFSIHEELGYMVKAGLTPYQALAMGTVNVAAFFQQQDQGLVAEGYRADLVLLGDNPLENIDHTRKVVGVMRAGQWLDRESLDRELAAIRKRKI
jgi:imidazolonepropionase-like amidohydrolase